MEASAAMTDEHRRFFRTYGFAVLAVLGVTLLRLPVEPFLHGRAPYALYYVAILWVAWYAGVGPTIVAIASSLASAWLFVVPGSEPGSYATVAIFLAVSMAMVVMARAAHATQDAQRWL